MGPEAHAARLRLIDLETTGDGLTNGGVVEVGWQDLVQRFDGRWESRGGPVARFVNPGGSISAITVRELYAHNRLTKQ